MNETTTVFFGGSKNKQSIVTYDWTTQTYNKNSISLTESRQGSACAAFKGNNSETLVIYTTMQKVDLFYLIEEPANIITINEELENG